LLDQHFANGVKIGLVTLASRANLADEFRLVETKRYDSNYTLGEQLVAYEAVYPEILLGPVRWGGLILRQHLDDDIKEFAQRWWWNVLRYSRRDQLSLPVALSTVDKNCILHIPGSEDFSEWHSRLGGAVKSEGYVVGGFLPVWPRGRQMTREAVLVAEVASLRKVLRSRWRKTARDTVRKALKRIGLPI